MHDDLTDYLVGRTRSSTPFVIKYVPYGALAEVCLLLLFPEWTDVDVQHRLCRTSAAGRSRTSLCWATASRPQNAIALGKGSSGRFLAEDS